MLIISCDHVASFWHAGLISPSGERRAADAKPEVSIDYLGPPYQGAAINKIIRRVRSERENFSKLLRLRQISSANVRTPSESRRKA